MEKICQWCGEPYLEGQDGICRRCWEKNQFVDKEDEPDAPEEKEDK